MTNNTNSNTVVEDEESLLSDEELFANGKKYNNNLPRFL